MSVKQPPRRYNRQEMRQIEGRNPIVESLRANAEIKEIYIEEKINKDDRIMEILHLARSKNIPITKKMSKNLRKMSKTGGHHQGVIVIAEIPDNPDFNQLLKFIRQTEVPPKLLIIPKVLYEHNLGAVLRSAESSGIDAVIVSKKVDVLSPVVNRTAMGAVDHLPIYQENMFMAMKALKKVGIKCVGLQEGGKHTVYDCNMKVGIALVIGAEDHGISEAVDKLIDEYVSIPMLGHIESLNMSVAASICMYEAVRQRQNA